MRTLLLHFDRDIDLRAEPAHGPTLAQDLELGTLVEAMAAEDPFLRDIARKVLLTAPGNDVATILYRQEILKDCLKNPTVVRSIYDLAVEAIKRMKKRKSFMGVLSRHPGSILYDAMEVAGVLVEMLGRLRAIADAHRHLFSSRGFMRLFEALAADLDDEYLTRVKDELVELRFPRGLHLSVGIGEGCEGTGYELHRAPVKRRRFGGFLLEWLLRRRPRGFIVEIHPRDQAGHRALSELKDRGIDGVANALAQSMDHVANFFGLLREELAFYVAGLNLHRALAQLEAPVAFPVPAPAGKRQHRCVGLYDPSLALRVGARVVGCDLAADGKSLCIVTGANQGGKTTFLRSLGLAQLMMQSGLFVAAESFSADVCVGLHSHFRREEDSSMTSGKLDEELDRMSAVIDVIRPDGLLLLNESFSATNEREGSEIAKQIVTTLVEKGIKVFFVTHLHAFARGQYDTARQDALFLRPERRLDGTRTFRIIEGEPLQTSFGGDVYREVFGAEPGRERTR